jgi:hypothetical protein
MELDKKRIEDAIIADVADKIIGEDELFSRVRKAIDQRINALFKDKADAQIAAAIDDAIRNGFDREYCRISSWGERQGEPTTIRKELEKLISGYWNEKVDRQGKPADYPSTNVTRAEWLMMQLVANDFKDDMKQHVVNVTAGLKDGLRNELHKTVNQLLSGTFHVKSLDDQKLDNGYSPHPKAE